MTACPEESRLQAVLCGDPAEPVPHDVTQHLDQCERCREKLDRLAGRLQTFITPQPVGNDLERAMQALKQSKPVGQTESIGSKDQKLDFLAPSDDPRHLGRLGEYDILEVVGRGGMGIVFKAHDRRLQRVVAVKVLAPELAAQPQARRRFLREAQAAAAISHDHVVTIHAVEEHGPVPYLVMEYIGGQSLQERLERDAPLELKEILRIGRQIALGLQAAHTQGLIHRDIKPANILLENGIQRVKITDFGIARAVDDGSLTQTGVLVGTPQFMAPEQASGEPVDHRADLFSLGSVLYVMCTGRSPFRAESSLAVLRRICDDEPRPIRELNADMPEFLCEIVARLLAKDPNDRFQSAAELAALLERHLVGLQQPFPGRSPRHHGRTFMAQSQSYWNELRPILLALVLLVVLSLVGMTLTYWGTQLGGLFSGGDEKAPLLTGPVELLRSFDPATDKTITQDGVFPEAERWRIHADAPRTVRLFEIRDLEVENCLLTYRARLRSELADGSAFLEMWCRIPGVGEFFSRGLNQPLTGSTDWTSLDAPFILQPGQRPDLIRLNLVINGKGGVWMREIELLKSPLPDQFK